MWVFDTLDCEERTSEQVIYMLDNRICVGRDLQYMQNSVTDQTAYSISERVVTAVADAAGVDPSALDAPLYDAVDPDALDKLYDERPHPTVEFAYGGHSVVVEPGGTVDVEASTSETAPTPER